MSRHRFTERQVIEALIRTGHEIRCYRTKSVITLETVGRLEREHVTPLKLGGADDPTNAAYSLKEAHAIQTNGTPATSAGSDQNMIAKARPSRAEKFQVKKLPLDADRVGEPMPRCRRCGEDTEYCQCPAPADRRSAFAGARR